MRTILKAVFTIIVLLALLPSLKIFANLPLTFDIPAGFTGKPGEQYFLTGSDYKGNYVYGGAMQLAVNELNDSILKDKLKLSFTADDSESIQMLTRFNLLEFTQKDLDEKSYYVKSGYGQKTVDTINKESKSKFPGKSFEDLNMGLGPKDIISYAYFLKQIEYPTAFEKDTVSFLGETVQGFETSNEEQKKNVKIINYEDDDNFIVKLDLKDRADEIFLAKGFDMKSPLEAIKIINGPNIVNSMGENDVFKVPEIHLDMKRDYKGFTNKLLLNPGFTTYRIKHMTEKIKFDMDNTGVRVENEGYIIIQYSGFTDEPVRFKRLVLDKPFWLIMKRSSSPNPYFILGVNNTEIMSK